MGKNLWMRAKTKANIKSELKMKVFWKTLTLEHFKTSKSHSLIEKLT